jgi:hypothetical protein
VIDVVNSVTTCQRFSITSVDFFHPVMKPFSREDRHAQTKEENELSHDWVEKINGSYGEPLTCGDRIYYIDH